ncbi:MAG: hypothetical protein LBQ15_11550 [Clostridium sp.]|nr:hypothetical protein [Clostridium sp.]
MVKSDAYYALITLFDRFRKQRSRLGAIVEDTIRGLIMFSVLSVLSHLVSFP